MIPATPRLAVRPLPEITYGRTTQLSPVPALSLVSNPFVETSESTGSESGTWLRRVNSDRYQPPSESLTTVHSSESRRTTSRRLPLSELFTYIGDHREWVNQEERGRRQLSMPTPRTPGRNIGTVIGDSPTLLSMNSEEVLTSPTFSVGSIDTRSMSSASLEPSPYQLRRFGSRAIWTQGYGTQNWTPPPSPRSPDVWR